MLVFRVKQVKMRQLQCCVSHGLYLYLYLFQSLREICFLIENQVSNRPLQREMFTD